MSDLDTLARAATRELLDAGVPDVGARYADLKRIRARRTTAKVGAVATVLALGIGGWQLGRHDDTDSVQPAEPTVEVHNGALLGVENPGSTGSSSIGLVYGGTGGPYGGMGAHLPTDVGVAPLLQFSADGRVLYYSDSQDRLAAWDLESGTKRVLADCPASDCASGSVAAGATSAAFTTDQNPVVVDLRTGRSETTFVPAVDVTQGALSPDGSSLAVASGSGLFTVDLRSPGSDTVRVSDVQVADATTGPAWSPDGGRIAFLQRSSSGDYTLMTVRADGSDLQALRDVGGCDCERTGPPSVTWSPDGTQLAVATTDPDAGPGVYTVRADGSGWSLRREGDWSMLAWQPVSGG